MANKGASVTVPAGAFTNTTTLLSTYIFSPPTPYWGTRRDAFWVFAENVGLLKRRFFFPNNPEYVEFRLVRYHVN